MQSIVPYVETTSIVAVAPAPSELIALLLDDKRSECTKRAYLFDLNDFFGAGGVEAKARAFCALIAPEMALELGRYKTQLRERGMSEATINRRLAAVRSLLKFAHRLGYSLTDGRSLVEGEKSKAYRDTRGVDVPTLRKLLAAPLKRYGEPESAGGESPPRAYLHSGEVPNIYLAQQDTHTRARALRRLHLSRDLAILHLLIENALRRSEICKLNVGDFDPQSKSLWILGKGRGSQKERVTVSADAIFAVNAYLAAGGHLHDIAGALFRNLDPRPEHFGGRITGDGLGRLVGEYGRFIGLTRLTPHQLRHSAITAALEATGGDIRKVKKFSRHAKVETVMIYDDNREDSQGEISGLLSGLVTGNKKARKH